MNVLTIAVYLEGSSDKALPILVQRVAQQMVNEHGWAERGWGDVDVLSPLILNEFVTNEPPNLPARLLAAARFAHGYRILVIHRDADAATTDKAKRKNELALKRVKQASANGIAVCSAIVHLVPIREMEAWLLADPDALRKVFDLDADTDLSDVPKHAREVEAIRDAKQRLNQVMTRIAPNANLEDIYETLAEAISLERLRQLSAFQEFERDLKRVLRVLEIIEPGT